MCGEKFSRSFVNMQESVLGMLSFPRSTAHLPHVTMQPLATNDERSEVEKRDRAAFARLRGFCYCEVGDWLRRLFYRHVWKARECANCNGRLRAQSNFHASLHCWTFIRCIHLEPSLTPVFLRSCPYLQEIPAVSVSAFTQIETMGVETPAYKRGRRPADHHVSMPRSTTKMTFTPYHASRRSTYSLRHEDSCEYPLFPFWTKFIIESLRAFKNFVAAPGIPVLIAHLLVSA
jgi:hypothetical protein